MNPSIIKLLEDDEDEMVHSGADVEAFTAFLNRDIKKNDTDADLPVSLETSSGPLSSMPSQLTGQWQAPSDEIKPIQQTQQNDEHNEPKSQEHQSSQDDQGNQQSNIINMYHMSNNQAGQSQVTSNPEILRTEQPQQHYNQHQEQNQQTDAVSVKPIETSQVKFPEQHHVQPHQEDNVQSRQQHSSQQLSSQHARSSGQAINSARKLSSIPFHALIPVLSPHLDKDRAMQLNDVFSKLKSNEISRDDFLRVIRNIVGDQMLRQAAQKIMQQQAQALAARSSQTNQGQQQFQTQVSSQQIASRGSAQFPEQCPFSQVQNIHTASSPHCQIVTAPGASSLKAIPNDNQMDSQGQKGLQISSTMVPAVKHERDVTSLPTGNKPSLSQVPLATFSTHGNASGNFNIHSFPRASVNSQATLRPQMGDMQIRQLPLPHAIVSNQPGTSQPVNLVNVSKYETQNIMSENKRLPGSISTYPNITSMQQKQIQWQQPPNKEQITLNSAPHVKNELAEQIIESQQGSSTTTPVPGVANTKITPRKPLTGQKKPADTQTTPPGANKKQKHVTFQDQSIDQLNDVTAVSGVNLKEEEEQLLSAPKEDSRASEAIRKAVQEEEESLILEKLPLQKKISEIISRCGIESISTDLERCLSMCVEERLRGVIAQLIRFSKQRVDIEKTRHRVVFTSDVRKQVLAINRQAKEEWDRKQAEESDKLRKLNETEGSSAADTEKEKDETRAKAPKANKDEDDKMRTTAANVAARAAVGGDDMLSKWQLMAEQARQRREGGIDSSSQPIKGSVPKSVRTPGKISIESPDGDRKDGGNAATSSEAMTRIGRNQATLSQPKVTRTVSIKDLIAVLEREPQMCKSPLMYRLYGRMSDDPGPE